MEYNSRIAARLNTGIITQDSFFEDFNSLLLIDAGTDGFILTDQNGNSVNVPSGSPIFLTGQQGELCRQIIVSAPLTGTMKVTYISDVKPINALIPPLFLYNDELAIITNDSGVIVDFNS